MSESSLQTQCPKCETRFRVNDAQLSVAKGKVRCGSCMSVFNAVENRVEEKTSSKPDKADAKDQASEEEDLLFADNPDEDASEGRYAGTKMTFSDDELSDSFRSVDEGGKNVGFEADDDLEEESVDESWAEAMLSDDPKAAPNSEPEKKQAPPQPAKPADPTPTPPPPRAPDPEPAPEPEPMPFAASTPPTEPSTPPPSAPPPEHSIAPEKDEYDGFFIDEQEPVAADPGFEPETDSLKATPYSNLRHEPIALKRSGSGRFRKFLWFLLILALLGGLVAQVVYYQFDRLSAIPELRPLYEKGCELAGCELKPLIDVESIQSRKLVVKTDPENRNQLVVDAVIINRASFEQPFPAIALTFSNLNNDVVAQSVFTPDEYLAGEGKTLDSMPTDTPVRILINIRDPGKDAVNYNLVFRAHSP